MSSQDLPDFQELTMEGEFEKIINEEFELMGRSSINGRLSMAELEPKRRILTRIKSLIKNGNQTSSAPRSMRLEFRNGISRTILTSEEIKGEDNASIEVALVDSMGNIVNVEPESSSNVEIVLVKREFDAPEGEDWTVEKFDENIVPEMEGKKPFLAGNVRVRLLQGVSILNSIKLRNHACKKESRMFRLGARVINTFDRARVKEAMTEFFTVKDFRNKYFRKHETPSLSDKVYRLTHIRKGGLIHKRLESSKICTVEDFLIRLLIDPEDLKSIVNLGAKKWENTVNNARACPDHKRMYCYIESLQKTGVVFNVLGQILGLYAENQYFTSTMLSENHKVIAQELLESAYNHWKDTVYFDDEGSLQQHFTGLSMFVDSQDFLEPYCPLVGDDICYGESSNGRSNSSFQSINSTRDDNFLDLLNSDEVEILCDGRSQLTPPPSDQQTCLSYVEYFLLHPSDNMDMSNADEPTIDLQTWISRFGDCVHQSDNPDKSNADEPTTPEIVEGRN